MLPMKMATLAGSTHQRTHPPEYASPPARPGQVIGFVDRCGFPAPQQRQQVARRQIGLCRSQRALNHCRSPGRQRHRPDGLCRACLTSSLCEPALAYCGRMQPHFQPWQDAHTPCWHCTQFLGMLHEGTAAQCRVGPAVRSMPANGCSAFERAPGADDLLCGCGQHVEPPVVGTNVRVNRPAEAGGLARSCESVQPGEGVASW